jgi:hypothetical protein
MQVVQLQELVGKAAKEHKAELTVAMVFMEQLVVMEQTVLLTAQVMEVAVEEAAVLTITQAM